MAIVYFKITFPAGLVHDRAWIGTLDNAAAFANVVKVLFWQDALGLGWGICQSSAWISYSSAFSPLAIKEKQSVMQVTEFEVARAVDPGLWGF